MPNSTQTDVLFNKGTINKLPLANRLVMGPMAAAAPAESGAPSEQTIAFFEARARGGIGLIIMGGSIATPRGNDESMIQPVLRLDTDETIPGFRTLTEAVHAYGVPIIAQLTAGFGRMGVPGPGRPLISASPKNVVIPQDQFPRGFLVPGGRVTPMPQEATRDEIMQYETEMIEAGVRSHKAGFDGVELAAHMSYFAASFLSPRTNWRTDEYGGSAENRARFLSNIVRGIREATGPDFVIGLLITANDYMPDGQGPQGYVEVAKHVEAAGLDFVALSAGVYETMQASAPVRDGALIEGGEARLFKEALSIPLMIQGLHDPLNAARAVTEGHGDYVMLARPMLADPEYANKLREKRPDQIVVCDRNNYCMRRMVFGMPVRCSVNPNMGRESRQKGESRPLKRWFQAPIEQAVLKATGSSSLMGLVGMLIRKKAKSDGGHIR